MKIRTTIPFGVMLFCAACSKTTNAPPGVLVITPQFGVATQFSEGLASVRIGDDKTGKWGYIDAQGHFVVNPQFDFGGRFRDGLAEVLFDSYRGGVIDKKGKFVVGPQFLHIGWGFSEGLAAAGIRDEHGDRWGYIDREGKFVINPQFDGAQ
jgi:hypothetical protein